MTASRKGQSVYLVLGMHRSGTSVAARTLQCLNLNLGDNLLKVNPVIEYFTKSNERGYFEDKDVVALDEDILNVLGKRWFQFLNLDPEHFNHVKQHGLFDMALHLVDRKFRQGDHFVIKDPRLIRLLWFWQPVFSQLNIDMKHILVIRNPASVASSLVRRNKFSFEHAILLWLEHMIHGIQSMSPGSLIIINFDRLIDDPASEIDRISTCLKLTTNDKDKMYVLNHYLTKPTSTIDFDNVRGKVNDNLMDTCLQIYDALDSYSTQMLLDPDTFRSDMIPCVQRYHELAPFFSKIDRELDAMQNTLLARQVFRLKKSLRWLYT